jgi:hypothetical protein
MLWGTGAADLLLTSRPALAVDQVHDEIQVYNAEIAGVGQWTYQQHLNYALAGQKQPEVPGGFDSNHSLQGTPEFAYGLTNWWEAGFYLPFAVGSRRDFLSDGAKVRNLFFTPDAAKRSFNAMGAGSTADAKLAQFLWFGRRHAAPSAPIAAHGNDNHPARPLATISRHAPREPLFVAGDGHR